MTATEILARFDEDGYCVIEGLLDPAEAERLDGLARASMDAERDGYVPLEGVLNHIPDMAQLCEQPLILEVAEAVLGKGFVIANTVALKWCKPGSKEQGLHGDWPMQATARPVPGAATPPWGGLAVRWMLTDFTAENGATKIVPFSHHLERPPARESYPQEIPVTGKRGSVFLYHNALWHRAGANTTSDQHRMLASLFYIPADIHRPPTNWPLLKRAVYARFSPRMQQLMERSVEPA
jgi:ectoine hydroxylase-related dioxygenase (phytanoyl-CoA dioxygenase family)